jgi:glucan 1,3-beta-glucosidase
VVLLAIIIPVAVVVSNNNNKASLGTGPSTNNLDGKDEESIPMQWRGTYLDPFSWADTSDFNVTFTDETVGDLPVMGLFDEWDDSAQANEKVPALNKAWGSYEKNPARGVNVGGWLSLEPFITPSLFNYDARYGVVDEYTLTTHLGSRKTREVLENHYATFVTESTFKEIRDAGLDHVRIPYSYWAVEVYEDDPYLFRVSWRYLLRGIEWCRKYGLRVKLDPHGIPGSQNGWNHSGRLGAINWLNGTSGAENRKRSLEFHDKISKFFAQDRYKNIIAFYGLANEPKMTELSTSDVIQWTEDAYKLVRDNGITAPVVFGDGFMGLHNWQGQMTGYDDLVLDVHQYVIFNVDQIALTHQKKVEYACDGWTKQAKESMDRSTGYGPTMFAEWSQADTDCAKHLTNVGWGNRWEGTIGSSEGESVLGPRCPTLDSKCDCGPANAKIEDMSDDYKKFLKMFAEAQMHSFENGWGWWYWTWDTEDAPLWSYKKALAGGIMPSKPWDRDFTCDSDVPSFSGLAETS